jgi:hypothetical protein
MEPTARPSRLISCAAIACLLAALAGCTEKPASPPPTPEKPKTVADLPPTAKSDAPAAANPQSTKDEPAVVQSPKAPPADEPSKPDAIAKPAENPAGEPNAVEDQKAADDNNKPADAAEKTADDDNRKPSKEMTDEEIAAEQAKQREAALRAIAEKLGPPLVENVEKLTKPHPSYPVWIDKEKKQVIMLGSVCQTNAPLEMFAVPSGTKEHEGILAIPTEAFIVHASLLAIGAKPGKPAEFGPGPNDYKPATGQPIEITVKWKNDKGEAQSARAQDWIKNVKTGKEMEQSWVFCGSGFWKDEQTGIEYYKAEGGDFICVSNFPSAMLDLPIESSQKNDALMFQANADRIPPLGTPVTVFLTPRPAPDSEKKTEPQGQSLSDMVPPDQRIQEKEEEKLPTDTSDAKE